MLQQKIIVEDPVGCHYRLQLFCSPPLGVTVEAEYFSDDFFTERFVSRLNISHKRWVDILQEADAGASGYRLTPLDCRQAIARLLVRGVIKVYRIDGFNRAGRKVDYPAITAEQGEQYRFMPVSAHLAGDVQDPQWFQRDPQQANDFIEQLNLTDVQLENVLKSLGLVAAGTGSAALAQAIASDQVVVARTQVSLLKTPAADAAQAADNAPVEEIAVRPASLGPHDMGGGVAAAAIIAQENEAAEKPLCTLQSAIIQCSHGRSVQITKETSITPSLSVISTETKEKGLELISAEIQADDLCTLHKNGAFRISREHKLKSTTATKTTFKVSCDHWNYSNFFERLWLPSIKPKTYHIRIKETCEAPDIKIKKVAINVYPAMKWHWSTNINFGKLDFVPGKAKVKYSALAIDGNVDLTYDGTKHDAKEKYKKYITEPLDGFKKICDAVAKVLEVINDPQAALMRIATQTDKKKPADGKDNKDGNETRLVIQWPKLSIDYDSALVENGLSTYVDHDYRIKLEAKPLLDIDIQVDVLDSMISLAPLPVAELIRYAKKRIEEDFEEEQAVGIRGELDIIFTVKATLDIQSSEIKGLHHVNEHDVTVAPVKGELKIPAKLKGAVKAEGKWFIISFSVHYGLKGETEWSGDYEFGQDDVGIYFSNTVEFKGIDVTLTKYEEVKVQVESKESQTDEMFEADGEISYESADIDGSVEFKDGQVKGEVTLNAEEEQRWSWMKPKNDTEKQASIKRYFVKH
ncbi:MAG: hypothetical protein L3J89_11765 [Gammaproteobacteria bacterium]|nr:hypothetical protein [Gammaproteobacteria bacterium]